MLLPGEMAPRRSWLSWFLHGLVMVWAAWLVISGDVRGWSAVILIAVVLGFAAFSLFGAWLWNRPIAVEPKRPDDPTRPRDVAGSSGETPLHFVFLSLVMLSASLVIGRRPGMTEGLIFLLLIGIGGWLALRRAIDGR